MYILASTLFFDFHSHCLLYKSHHGNTLPCLHGVSLIWTTLRGGGPILEEHFLSGAHLLQHLVSAIYVNTPMLNSV